VVNRGRAVDGVRGDAIGVKVTPSKTPQNGFSASLPCDDKQIYGLATRAVAEQLAVSKSCVL
jgi:hypothetical protein